MKRDGYKRYFSDLEYERAPGTVDAYTYTIKKYLNFLDGEEPSQSNSEEFLNIFKDKGNSPRSVQRHITALRHFFAWMDKPLKLKSPYLQRTIPPYTTEDEFSLMMNKAVEPKLRAALALTFGGGLRLKEVCSLMVDDINQEEGYIRVIGKGGKERLVPVEDEIINMAKPWINHVRLYSKYMFPGQDPKKPQRKNGFQAMIRNHMRRCGIKGKHVHSLRHGAATSLYSRGLDLRQIQEFLGHENIATTALYTHMTPGKLRKSIIKVRRFG